MDCRTDTQRDSQVSSTFDFASVCFPATEPSVLGTSISKMGTRYKIRLRGAQHALVAEAAGQREATVWDNEGSAGYGDRWGPLSRSSRRGTTPPYNFELGQDAVVRSQHEA